MLQYNTCFDNLAQKKNIYTLLFFLIRENMHSTISFFFFLRWHNPFSNNLNLTWEQPEDPHPRILGCDSVRKDVERKSVTLVRIISTSVKYGNRQENKKNKNTWTVLCDYSAMTWKWTWVLASTALIEIVSKCALHLTCALFKVNHSHFFLSCLDCCCMY